MTSVAAVDVVKEVHLHDCRLNGSNVGWCWRWTRHASFASWCGIGYVKIRTIRGPAATNIFSMLTVGQELGWISLIPHTGCGVIWKLRGSDETREQRKRRNAPDHPRGWGRVP